MKKQCTQCGEIKEVNSDNFSWEDKAKGRYCAKCKACLKEYSKKYNEDNKEIISIKNKEYRKNNKEKISEIDKLYKEKNKDKLKEQNSVYYEKNKEEISIKSKIYASKPEVKERRNKNEREKRLNNPSIRIKQNISASIGKILKLNGKIKSSSILCHLPYSIENLILHLESLWEPWMTWNNYGRYNKKTWDDNDSSTWIWQLDHIIPHSKFEYELGDEEFKKCWKLSNLRPYSAKLNNIDGGSGIRHKENQDANWR